MNEAQGAAGQEKLPACRGRFPHLNAYAKDGCDAGTHLILIGASNLWFPILQSVIVMPMDTGERKQDLVDRLRATIDPKHLAKYADHPDFLRDLAEDKINLKNVTDDQLTKAAHAALNPSQAPEDEEGTQGWSPNDLLIPEWNYLKLDAAGDHHSDPDSGLTVRNRTLDPALAPQISRLLAVEKLREATALLGFTRIDEMDRIEDLPSRRAPLSSTRPGGSWRPRTAAKGSSSNSTKPLSPPGKRRSKPPSCGPPT
ncbi:hypothetical protein [Raineyella fluvialis]|uniref:hypothetical protein n=1 Tax=Raineyella fluvialis TaxID=2662261 RepID=UPI001E590658|nr:hypothetical protein [Raineyella fluvialis]